MEAEWDAIVVGGGPAGSASATLLARAGYRVGLLDRAHFPRHKACAEYMSPGVAEVLSRTGLGDALQGVPYQTVPGMEIVSPLGARLRVDYRSETGALAARTLPRYVFDWKLLEGAGRAGVHVIEGTTARQLIRDGDRVRGVSASCDGRVRTFRARLTVIADGSRSTLARSLQLAQRPRWPVRLGLVAHFEGSGSLEDGYGQMHVGHGGYCGVAPLPGNLLNVAMVVRMDALLSSKLSATNFFKQWISSHPQLRETLSGFQPIAAVRGVGPIGSRSHRTWAPGALLVGDAASFFDPFTGEGIFRALRGAELVSEVARSTFEARKDSTQYLRTYDALRRKAFRKKSAVTALVQLFVQYPWLMEYALPRLVERESQKRTLGLVLGDVLDAGEFLRPRTLWSALRP